MKPFAIALASAAATASLWFWTATRLAYQASHRDDGLHAVICYFEQRTENSPTLTHKAKLEGIRVLDAALRKALLPPCTP